MINPHLKTRHALRGEIVLDDVPFLLTPLSENDEGEKLVIKANCDLEHDVIVVSKNIFV